jgi:hypothetical protein
MFGQDEKRNTLMTIQLGENSIKLIPESEWEKEALQRLKNRGINKMQFQDEWNREGWLRLEHNR